MLSSRYGLIVAMAALSGACLGQALHLSNNGSSAIVNVGTGSGDGNFGLNDWRVFAGGPNQVVEQAYFYRIGTGQLQAVNEIANRSVDQPTNDLATVTYHAPEAFDLSFRYLLTGGPPTNSDVAEVVTLHNLNFGLTFTLYEYDFFSIGGSTGGTGTLLNSSTIRLANSAGSVTVGATNIPDRWMIDTSANVNAAMSAGNLTNANSPFTNATDVAFGYQWNVQLSPQQSWQMSKDKLISAVPEPATLTALGLGLLAIRRRRR